MRLTAPALVAALALALPTAGTAEAAPPRLDLYTDAISDPVEDSYYPSKGDPGIDVLHYDLDLDWRKGTRVLRGVAEVSFRATENADSVQLDLSSRLNVQRVSVDGTSVDHTHDGNHLVITAPVAGTSRHTARVVYRGTPGPARGPASRSDVAKVGMRVTKGGELWTMQEPFGAFTWYPANDQPSDKAYYDVRVSAPGSWVGVSNGRLVSRSKRDGRTVTRWTTDNPMSSYLATLAVGPYRRVASTGPGNLPISYWVPRNRPGLLKPLRKTPAAMRWLVSKLGPYPFDTLGIVVTPSASAMETQTMVTFGRGLYRYGNRYVRQTMVHELAHQWYGDTVTPTDWRDLWMNEGMATYLDTRWAVDQGWTRWRAWQRHWAAGDQHWRDTYGPPGDYEHGEFASINVYYSTALMWDRLRQKVGTARFNRLVKAWPQQHRDSNQDRRSLINWFERRSGRELSRFFNTWLNSPDSPA